VHYLKYFRQQQAMLASNSQYAQTGDAFGEKAVDLKLAEATSKAIDKWSGRGASARAESKTGC
jgi:hypothetical protein